MLPDQLGDEGITPGGATHGDKMTNIAESTGSMRAKLKEAGFVILKQETFLFTPEITPNWIFTFTRAVETMMEKIRIFNFMATTQFVKAEKPV